MVEIGCQGEEVVKLIGVHVNATKAVASTLGVLAGLAGVEHGYFETLQGNVTPIGRMIEVRDET